MRLNKLNQFDRALPNIKSFFIDKVNSSACAVYFKNCFGLEITPNDDNIKDSSYLELCWKDRIIDIDSNGEHKETGARLRLSCSSAGYVKITIFPCFTEDCKCKEDEVILYHRLNPWWLSRKLFMQHLWWTFISYSAVTAIDGTPSFFSRVHVNLVRYFSSKSVNGVLEGKRFWRDMKFLIGVMFAIITSDLFVYYLPDRTKDEEIQFLEKQIENQKKQIDCMSKFIDQHKDYNQNIDSLNCCLKQIEKNTKPKENNKIQK